MCRNAREYISEYFQILNIFKISIGQATIRTTTKSNRDGYKIS